MSTPKLRTLSSVVALAAFAAIMLPASRTQAGGGGENAVIVINADSWASLAVANEYIHLRQVPPNNVVYLGGLGAFESIPVDRFRQLVLKPVLETIMQRGLVPQIDYIIYSADMPWLVSLVPEVTAQDIERVFDPGRSDPNRTKPFTLGGSINGLTYLYPMVLAKDLHYMSLFSNRYYRQPAATPRSIEFPSAAFRNSYEWSSRGARTDAGDGMRYMLSGVLACTSGRGVSVAEAIASLRRAVAADGTAPKGTVYLMQNKDVRSTVRQPQLEPTAAQLGAMGIGVKLLDGVLPNDCNDVAGLLTGTPSFNWPASHSTILPGALCDNFTSWGGVMWEGYGQTPLTEFLRYGAAVATGTVIEPYSAPHKFTTALSQVHYARGCSAAEAIYQSLVCPYQLLVVGDLLCQPWAKVPQVTVKIDGETAASPQPAKGTIRVLPTAGKDDAVAEYELFLDGRRFLTAQPGTHVDMDTTGMADGYHELRVVAVASGDVQTRGRAIVALMVDNRGQRLAVTPPASRQVSIQEPISLSAAMPGAARIVFMHNGRMLAAITGEKGVARIDPNQLGLGPVRIESLAVVAREDGKETAVAAPPIDLQIIPGPFRPSLEPMTQLVKGVQLILADGRKIIFEKATANWLAEGGVRQGELFTISAYFTVPSDDVYQFQVNANAALTVEVDDHPLGAFGTQGWVLCPISLAAGVHKLQVRGKDGGDPQVEIRFGGPGSKNILNVFHHLPDPAEKKYRPQDTPAATSAVAPNVGVAGSSPTSAPSSAPTSAPTASADSIDAKR